MVQGRGLGTTETEATHYRRFACNASRDDRVFGLDAVPVERHQREDLVVRSDATRVGSDRDDYPG
jgi:hypothetical protein